jgi:hypothetical protein
MEYEIEDIEFYMRIGMKDQSTIFQCEAKTLVNLLGSVNFSKLDLGLFYSTM